MTPDQHEHWNSVAGPLWVAVQDAMDRLLEPLGRRTLEAARPAAGERVLDVGCGCGHTTLTLAEQVGPSGLALGVDLSQVMLERALERAAASRSTARFRTGDVQTDRFEEGPFDLIFSRFGTMFFPDPVQAFANLRRALRPGGRMAFICWQPLPDNPLFRLPVQAAQAWVTLPAPTPPDAPGPFSLAAPGRATALLEAAGWVEVDCQPWEGQISLGGVDETVDLVLTIGPAALALAEADQTTRAQVAHELRRLLVGLEQEGRVTLSTANWLVTAR